MATHHGRPILPNEDIYPPPLMTQQPSRKVYGNDRLWFALQYLQIGRIKELLKLYGHLADNLDFHTTLQNHSKENKKSKTLIYQTHSGSEMREKIKLLDDMSDKFIRETCHNAVDFYLTDYYEQNMLHELSTRSLCSNFNHSTHQEEYETLVQLLLKELSPFATKILLSQKSGFGRTPLEEALRNNLFHFALKFLKLGAPMPENQLYVRDQDTYVYNFYTNPELIQNYLAVCQGKEHVCPITLEKIRTPAVLEDGSIYEKDAIVKYFTNVMCDMNKYYQLRDKVNLEYQYNKLFLTAQCDYPSCYAFCHQWEEMYTYRSPVTNLELIGEPILYLPLTDEFLFL